MKNKPLTKTGIHFAVIYTVAKQYKVPIELIMSSGRGINEVKEARTMAIYLTRQYCKDYSTAEIGWIFSRDYSSVTNACHSAEDKMVRDRGFKKQVVECQKIINSIKF